MTYNQTQLIISFVIEWLLKHNWKVTKVCLHNSFNRRYQNVTQYWFERDGKRFDILPLYDAHAYYGDISEEKLWCVEAMRHDEDRDVVYITDTHDVSDLLDYFYE